MSDAHDPDFYLAHASYVRSLARRLVYDRHAADDLFQAAWLAALQRPARDGSAPRPWLARIVRNLAAKAWLGAQRRQRREGEREPQPPPSPPEAVLAHEQERRRVVSALLALDEPYWSTLIARFFDGLDAEQIAARDGVPVDTVRTRTKRGLQRLRDRLLPGGSSAIALVHGLQLDTPTTRAVLERALRAILVMHTKKLLAAAAVLLFAIGWLAFPRTTPLPDDPANAPPIAATAAPASTPAAAAPASAAPELQRSAAEVASAEPASTGAMVVRVLWPDRRPAIGIGVHVACAGASNHAAHAFAGRTDAEGRARFAPVPSGEAWIECDRGTRSAGTIAAGRSTEVVLTIDRGARLHGHVRDLDGRPVAAAQVYLLCRFAPHEGDVVARTDAEGAFAIEEVPVERTLSLSASAPLRTPTPQRLLTAHVGEDREVDLQFVAHGGSVCGRAVDERGEPVVDAFVLVGPELGFDAMRAKAAGRGEAPPIASRRARTDARGEWCIDGVAAGAAAVLVMTPKLAPWTGEVCVVDGEVARCLAQLTRGTRLQGVVHDERGAALAGASVQVARTFLQTWRTQTDATGAYSLDGLPASPFAALASLRGAGEARTTLPGAVDATLRWDPRLVRATTLRGRVLAANAPVAKASVTARTMPSPERPWFAEALTDADGRFELTNCPDALLHLDVHTAASGHFCVCRRDDVDPRAGDVVLEVDTTRLPNAVVGGRVLAVDGAPIAGAEISVLTMDHEWGGGHALRSDQEGRFHSPPLPAGAWYLTIQREGFAQLSVPPRPVAANTTTDFGDLVLTRGSALVVTLQPDAGIAIDSCVVGIADAVTGLASERPTHGVVRFPRLTPGDYTLTAYAPGAALRPRTVRVADGPETAIALRLTAGSEVTLDVRDERGEPVQERLETELHDGQGARIDMGPLMPGGGPLQWVRRLGADRYELHLHDHRQRKVVVPFVVADDGAPVRRTVRFP